MTHFDRMVIRTIDPSQYDRIEAFERGISSITGNSVYAYARNRFDRQEILGEYGFVFDKNTMPMERLYQINPDNVCLSIDKIWVEGNEVLASMDIYNDNLVLDDHEFKLRVILLSNTGTVITENTQIEAIIIIAVDLIKKE